MKSWYDVYLEEIKLKKNAKNYIEDKIKHKRIFIKMLKKYSSSSKKMIEAGCGTGIISAYMANIGYNVTGIDIDKNIIQLAKKISNEYFDVKKNNILFQEKNIFNLNYKDKEFDVCFSNGVLEHFKDEEIVETLQQQIRISNYVLVGIPTQFFDKSEALHGDERFLPIDYWRYLITKSGGRIIEEKNFHYMNTIEKILNFKKRLGRPKPFRLFIIEEL